jgi:hypothetical protein
MRFGELARKAGNGLPSVCYRAPPQRISPVIVLPTDPELVTILSLGVIVARSRFRKGA